MEKKPYSSPELTALGDVAQLTKGQGWVGSSDMMFVTTPEGWSGDVTYGHS